jgi:hypothetical protein
MAVVRVTNTRQIQGSTITVADLAALIEGVPSDATVTVNYQPGDFREPGYATLTVNYQPGDFRKPGYATLTVNLAKY